MKLKTYSQRLLTVVLSLLAVMAIALSAPYFLFDAKEPGIVLRSLSVMAADRYQHDLTRPIRLVASPYVAVESGKVAMSGADRLNEMPGSAMLELLESGRSDLVLSDATISIVAGPPSDADVAEVSAFGLAPLAEALRRLSFKRLAIRNSKIIVSLPSQSGDGGSIAFEATDLDVSLNRTKSKLTVKGRAVLRGRQITLDSIVRIPNAPGPDGLVVSVVTQIESELFSTSFKGSVPIGSYPRLTASGVRIEITDVPEAARWLGLSWPTRPLITKLVARGDLEWADAVAALQNGTFEIDGDTATGTLALNTKNERAAIDGTLAFDSIDVTRFITPPRSILQPVLDSADWIPEMVAKSTGYGDFGFLDVIDADLRLSAGRAHAGATELGRSAATVSLRSGKLLADIAELQLANGGRGSAQVNIDVNEDVPACRIRAQVKGYDVQEGGRMLFDYPVLSGFGDLTVELAGTGHTTSAVMKSLNGTIALNMTQGAEFGLDLAAILENASRDQPAGTKPPASIVNSQVKWLARPVSVSDDKKALAWAEATSGRTQLKNARLNLELHDGRLQTHLFNALTAGGTHMAAKGSVSLQSPEIEMSFWLGPGSSTKAGEPADIGRLVHLSGNRTAPVIIVVEHAKRLAGAE